jgi:hypothetical protein
MSVEEIIWEWGIVVDLDDEDLANPDECTIEGENSKIGVVGEKSKFLIVARDSIGNELENGGETFSTILYHKTLKDVIINASIKDLKNGKYEVSYTPNTEGEYDMDIFLIDKYEVLSDEEEDNDNGRMLIKGCPMRVTIQKYKLEFVEKKDLIENNINKNIRWQKFDNITCSLFEKNYSKDKTSTFDCKIQGINFNIDFSKMLQTNLSSKKTKYIRRSVIQIKNPFEYKRFQTYLSTDKQVYKEKDVVYIKAVVLKAKNQKPLSDKYFKDKEFFLGAELEILSPKGVKLFINKI